MKKDYTKVNGGVINEDIAGDYQIALRRRERNNKINELLELLPELKDMIDKFKEFESKNL